MRLSSAVSALALPLLAALPASATPVQESRTTPSGLVYRILEPGDGGASPQLGDTVTVHYTGTLTDGTEFDSSRGRGRPATFVLGKVIQGWNEGLALMTRGARFELTIPPDLGYGARGAPPTIPPGATLVFDVELIDFEVGEHPLPYHPADAESTTKTDSGLGCMIVRAGDGEPIAPDAMVEFAYAVYSPEGQLLDASAMGSGPIRVRVEELGIPGLREGLTRLTPGSLARFDVPAQLGTGGGDAIWMVELLGVVEPLPIPAFERPAEEDLETTASGLQYEMIEAGEGPHPIALSTVTVHYAGWLARDGELFDSSYGRGEPATFRLDQVIAGWTEGLQLMRPGATCVFVIPSRLAYGPPGRPPVIGPDEDLVFHVELLAIE